MSENVHIQDKLADIQRKMNVPKSQYNKFGNYNYRNAEDILSEFKKYSSEYGLCLTINDEVLEIGGRIYVRATATLKSGAESISISGYAREAEKQKGMDEAQITGAASSYARKYALNGMFLLDDVKDPDISQDTEAPGQFYVVYECEDGAIWSRPYGMFVSEVDHVKYPNVKQKYEAFRRGLEEYKREIEFNVGLAYGDLSDAQEVDKTATEVLASKTRKYNRVTAIQSKLEECLNGFVNALAFYNGSYMSGVEFTCEFNDSILADEESERQQDRQDVSMGVMSLLEYRMKWYNEDEETAKSKIPEQNQVME